MFKIKCTFEIPNQKHMIRIVLLSGKYYGKVVILDAEEIENIEAFLSDGMPVILTDDLESLQEYDIDPEDVEIVS